MNPERRLIRIVTGCAVVVVLLHLIFAFWRIPTGWGIHALAFFPAWFSVGATALALLLLLPAVSDRAVLAISGIRIPEVHLPLLRARHLRYALVSLLFLIPFYLLRVRVQTLGDGPLYVRMLTEPLRSLSSEPLTVYLVHFLYAQTHGAGEADALWVYQVLSWACGVLYVFVSLLMADAIGRDRRERTILRLFLMTVGTMELFCGYAGHYAPLTVAVLVYLYLAWRYLDGQSSLTAPVLAWSIAFAFHFSAPVLFPSLAFLYYTEWRRSPSKSGLYLRLVIPPALILAILLLIGFDLSAYFQRFRTESHTVPFWTPEPFYRSYTLLSPIHIADVVNQHLLVAPMGLLLIGVILLTVKDRIVKNPYLILLGSAAFFYALFACIFYPKIGAFRDWDLLSPIAVPVVLLTAYLLARCTEQVTQGRLAWVVAVVTFFHLVPWLWINADADRSVARYAATLKDVSRLSLHAGQYGYDELREIYERMGKKREALEATKAAFDANPRRPWLLLNVLRLMKEVGESEKSESLLKEMIARYPTYFYPRYHLANLYLEKGDLDNAIREYHQFLKSDPDHVNAHINLGIVLYKKGDLDGAIGEFRQAITINPQYAEAHCNLGNALVAKGDIDGAIREYRQAITINPQYTEAHNNLGFVLYTRNDLDGAIGEYLQALKVKPDNAEARLNLGSALTQKGDIDGAIREYRQVIRIDPNFVNAYFLLGFALANKGDSAGAIQELRTYIRLSTDERWKQTARERIRQLGGTP